MDRKKLIYHKENIEKAQDEVERWVAHKKDLSKDDLCLYATMKGAINALGWVLEELEKYESRNRMRADTDSVVISVDGIDKRLIDTADFIIR